MPYTNSPMVSYIKLSPNHSGQRTHSIDRITPHCVVGQCSVETLGNVFLPTSRQASSNYGIGVDGRVGMYVEEENRSWCSSSASNDQRAVTIECASDNSEPYAFKDVVYQRLIELCTDICKRNGKTKLLWLGDKSKTLGYTPAPDEMVLTVHRWFANKSCPGDWMYARMGDLAEKVTAALGGDVNPANPVKPTPAGIKAGDLVTITGSIYYNGKAIPGWVNSIIVNGNEGSVQTTDISVETGKDIWLTINGPEDYTVSYEEIALEETNETVATQEPAEAVEATIEAAENTEKSTPVVPIVIGVLVVVAAGGAAVAVSKKKSQK